jgi:hypothetical protein
MAIVMMWIRAFDRQERHSPKRLVTDGFDYGNELSSNPWPARPGGRDDMTARPRQIV